MQKLLFGLSFGLLAILFSGNAMAQTVVKFNIFSPLVRTGSFFVEHALSENKSAQLGVFYTGMSIENTKFSGYGITPEFRFYLSATEAPKGVYLAPYLRYQSFSLREKTTTAKASFSTIGGGLLVGKQWIFKERISLDAFIGPGYNKGNLKVEAGEDQDFEVGSMDGFTVRPGLTLGFKF